MAVNVAWLLGPLTSKGWTTGICRICFATLLTWMLGSAYGEELPLYKLSVGQDLTYTNNHKFEYGSRSTNKSEELRYWVTHQNADGSWRVIVKRTEDGNGRGTKSQIAYFDLFPDGHFTSNPSLGPSILPNAVFVHLATNDQEAGTSWESVDDTNAERRIHQRAAKNPDPNKLVIEIEVKSAMNDIYLVASHANYTFDNQRGVIERVTTTTSQKYGIDGKGTGTVELKAVKIQSPEWIKDFKREVTIYLDANQRYEQLLTSSQKDVQRTAELLKEANSTLVAARQELKIGDLTTQLDRQISEHAAMARYYSTSAERIAKVLGKPAHEFATTDFEGKMHSLKDYRGKVVILDFWYRGCGWCIRAMPQINQVATKFSSDPVCVLGMNTDRNDEDARFVMERMQLNYTNLKAEGLPEKFEVSGFPTLIIIDQKGIVREVHVGYSANLADEVTKSVRQLISES